MSEESQGVTDYQELLIKVAEVEETQLNQFHDSLPENGKIFFERIDQIRKRVIYILSKYSGPQILQLRRRLGDYPPVFHDFNNILSLMESCFYDERTGQTASQLSEVFEENQLRRQLVNDIVRNVAPKD